MFSLGFAFEVKTGLGEMVLNLGGLQISFSLDELSLNVKFQPSRMFRTKIKHFNPT